MKSINYLHSLLLFFLITFYLLLSPNIIFGWGTLTHAIIGEQTGTGSGYNNVPDYWKSWQLLPFPEISPYFLWSHECKVVNGRLKEPERNINITGAMDDSPSNYVEILYSKMIKRN